MNQKALAQQGQTVYAAHSVTAYVANALDKAQSCVQYVRSWSDSRHLVSNSANTSVLMSNSYQLLLKYIDIRSILKDLALTDISGVQLLSR